MAEKVALVEFNTWHHECLDSQILFLKESGYEVILVNDIRKKTHIEEKPASRMCECLFFDFRKIWSFVELQRYINRNHIGNVILNTAQGSGALKFCVLPFLHKTNIVGTIHNTIKLESSLGQKLIIRKIRKVYVLSPYLVRSMTMHQNLKSAVFSPVFFPEKPCADIVKPQDETWACIPGNVEYGRRDYGFLVQVATSIRRNMSDGRKIKFIILGNIMKGDGIRLKHAIQEYGLQDLFVTFREFVPDDIFNAYVMHSDVILPLVHPEIPGGESYTRYKISGSFSIAKSAGKLMLCHCMFKGIDGFDYNAMFYSNMDDFMHLLRNRQTVTDYPIPGRDEFERNRLQYISLLE